MSQNSNMEARFSSKRRKMDSEEGKENTPPLFTSTPYSEENISVDIITPSNNTISQIKLDIGNLSSELPHPILIGEDSEPMINCLCTVNFRNWYKKEKILFPNTPPLFPIELSRKNSFTDKDASGSPPIPPSGIVVVEGYFTQDFLAEPALLPKEVHNKRSENLLEQAPNIDMGNFFSIVHTEDYILASIRDYDAPIIGDSPTAPPKNGGDVNSSGEQDFCYT